MLGPHLVREHQALANLLIRRQLHERWRPRRMPPDVMGQRSLVRIIDLYCAALSGQNPATPLDSFEPMPAPRPVVVGDAAESSCSRSRIEFGK